MISAFHLSKLYSVKYYWLERKAISLKKDLNTCCSLLPTPLHQGLHFLSQHLVDAWEDLKSWVDSIQGEKGCLTSFHYFGWSCIYAVW